MSSAKDDKEEKRKPCWKFHSVPSYDDQLIFRATGPKKELYSCGIASKDAMKSLTLPSSEFSALIERVYVNAFTNGGLGASLDKFKGLAPILEVANLAVFRKWICAAATYENTKNKHLMIRFKKSLVFVERSDVPCPDACAALECCVYHSADVSENEVKDGPEKSMRKFETMTRFRDYALKCALALNAAAAPAAVAAPAASSAAAAAAAAIVPKAVPATSIPTAAAPSDSNGKRDYVTSKRPSEQKYHQFVVTDAQSRENIVKSIDEALGSLDETKTVYLSVNNTQIDARDVQKAGGALRSKLAAVLSRPKVAYGDLLQFHKHFEAEKKSQKCEEKAADLTMALKYTYSLVGLSAKNVLDVAELLQDDRRVQNPVVEEFCGYIIHHLPPVRVLVTPSSISPACRSFVMVCEVDLSKFLDEAARGLMELHPKRMEHFRSEIIDREGKTWISNPDVRITCVTGLDRAENLVMDDGMFVQLLKRAATNENVDQCVALDVRSQSEWLAMHEKQYGGAQSPVDPRRSSPDSVPVSELIGDLQIKLARAESELVDYKKEHPISKRKFEELERSNESMQITLAKIRSKYRPLKDKCRNLVKRLRVFESHATEFLNGVVVASEASHALIKIVDQMIPGLKTFRCDNKIGQHGSPLEVYSGLSGTDSDEEPTSKSKPKEDSASSAAAAAAPSAATMPTANGVVK